MMSGLLNLSKLIRERYVFLIIATLLISMVTGIFTISPGRALKPFATAFIVLMIASMGFTITLKSLSLAFKEVKGFSFGMTLNFILSPILCFLLSLFISNPEIAVGVVLIGAVPCAGMAIVWAGLLEGDVPLSVVINTGTMIAAPFLIPFIMRALAHSSITINTTGMFLSLLSTVLAPVIAGIVVREAFEWKGYDVKKLIPLCPALSSLCAVFLLFIAVNMAMPLILQNLSSLPSLMLSIILIFPIMFGVAYIISKHVFDRRQNIAITYASGMKNLPIALGIAMTSFEVLTALPVALGFIFQMITAVGFYRLLKKA